MDYGAERRRLDEAIELVRLRRENAWQEWSQMGEQLRKLVEERLKLGPAATPEPLAVISIEEEESAEHGRSERAKP